MLGLKCDDYSRDATATKLLPYVDFFSAKAKQKYRDVGTIFVSSPCVPSILCAPLAYKDLVVEQKWQML